MRAAKRNVKRTSSPNLKSIGRSSYTRAQKAQIRSRERAKKIALTKAKIYLLYAVGCFLAAQLIKYLLYSVLFRAEATPSGTMFLLVIYIQTGLLLATFVFLVMAVFKTLQRLLTEEL